MFFFCVVARTGGSVDTEMDRLHLHVDTPCGASKSSSKKSVFGSLERSMDKLLCMLTPKKKRSTPSFDEPRTVKVCSVEQRSHFYCTGISGKSRKRDMCENFEMAREKSWRK